MTTVSVEKRLLWALAGVAGLSLLAVAFLLGRASGGSSPTTGSSGTAAPAKAEGTRPSAPVAASEDEASADIEASAVPVALPLAPEPGRPVPALPTPASGLAPPDDPERAAVAAYLVEVDAIQASGVAGGPESAANEMAAALARGDASGLDRLVDETEEARRRLLAIAPPAACAAHHRETVASFDDALGMLRALREASASSDPAVALSAIAAQATALRTRAETLQREDRRLRERAGRLDGNGSDRTRADGRFRE